MSATHEFLIANAEEGFTRVESIDRERAEKYLTHNTANRKLKPRQIEVWARAMAEGRWKLTGESIKFARTGRLLDGQNRLSAIVLSDATVRIAVTYGLEDDTQEVMDSGSRRTAADALELRGERHTKSLQAAANMIFSDGGRARRSASNDELIELVTKDPSIRDIVCDVIPHLGLSSLIPSAVQFYAYWTLNRIVPDRCASFFTALSTLEGLSAGSPVLALHRRLLRTTHGKGSHAYRQEALACIYSAWNAWVKGEERAKIQLSYGEFGRLNMPVPVTP